MDNSWYTREELIAMGIVSIGQEVYVSRKCSIYNGRNIVLGSNIRIDDYCVVTAGGPLVLEGYNHIGAFCYINSAGGLTLKLFSGISSRCSVYTASDSFDGSALSGPLVPSKYRSVTQEPVYIGRHVIIGSNSTVLPGCVIGDYSAIGAHSLVTSSIPPYKIAVGVPAKPIKDRKLDIVELEGICLSDVPVYESLVYEDINE